MSIPDKAIWLIETQMGRALDLSALSAACAVSPYHLSRTFRFSTGMSPMAYLRARRLSHAAEQLVRGNDDILSIALDAQYGSHEAFTRAFVSCFGVPPSTVRQARSIKNLKLLEPIEMDKSRFVNVAKPELKDIFMFEIVGLGTHCTFDNISSIRPLWQAFNQREDEVENVPNAAGYGVCHGADKEGNFSYLAGVEAKNQSAIPSGMERLSIPAGKYAVFVHEGHISDIGNTVYTIWNKALPDLGLTLRQAPDFEKYDKRFDGKTGRGLVEIYIPVS